jgi:2',3'-cyclic-nucleotide 2'-phosphodiesterase (5'-nucleotidase family)
MEPIARRGCRPDVPRRSTRSSGALGALGVLVLVAGCGDAANRRTGAGERSDRAVACPPRTEATKGALVTVFHETHTHGSLVATPDRPRHVTFARYVGLRNALRACLARPEHSLFLGNGDDVSRVVDGYATDGRHVIDAFNASGLDANTFGFNEILFGEGYDSFRQGFDRLRELVAASRFTWVSANVRDARRPERVFAAEQGAGSWTLARIGGVRVGITGLVSPRFNPEDPTPLPSGVRQVIRVVEPVRAARAAVREMRSAKAEVVILLSHMSDQETRRVVRAVDGIDAALGTHAGAPTDRARVVDGTIVAVAGPEEMHALGRLDLVVREGRVVDYAFRRHPLPASVRPDRTVESAIGRHLR